MNLVILTKVSKHTLVGSISAYLSFASRNNPSIKLFFIYILGGTIVVFVVAALWEARDYLTAQNPTEEQLTTLMSSLTNQQASSRKYYLSAQTRLEIVIVFVVIIACALVGAI